MVENKKEIKWTEYNEPFIAQRADPYVYKHKGEYYFTASVPTYDKIILRNSKTIKGLQESTEIEIWRKHENGKMSEHIWAPEIHYINGEWYIYFAAGEKDNVWEIRPFVLKCTGQNPMTDKWIECGMMKCAVDDIYSFRAFSLDATILEHKGEYYFIWAEKVSVGIQISNLYIAKMKSPTELETSQVLLTTPDYDWERVGIWVNEGPAVLKKNNKIFITFSASSTGAEYCVGLLEIDENNDLLDPQNWKKHRQPVLTTDYDKCVFGTGHNSFVKSENDLEDIMIYHARPYENIVGDPLYDPNRHAMLLKVKWNESGVPVFEIQKSKELL